MRRTTLVALAAAFALCTLGLRAQQASDGLAADLMKDISEAESKITALARAMSDKGWAWRPASNVRSTAEVIAHVATDNYVFPAGMGIAAPAATGIDRLKFETAQAFEKRTRTRAQAMTDLADSFTFLKQQLGKTSDARLAEPLIVFGRPSSRRATWIEAAAHLHEHLGQLIAYARSNGTTPPWSN